MLRIFESYVNWLHHSSFVLLSRLFHVICSLICVLAVCGGHSLKSQVVYSKQPKLGLTQEFVVDCAHALWVVRSIKRLVSLMLLKWFLSDSFIYFMYRCNENF